MVRRRERGQAVLVLAILLLAILVIVVTQMTLTSAQSKFASGAALSDLQNTYAIRSGYEHALLHLKTNAEKEEKVDYIAPEEKWSQTFQVPVGKSTVWVRIEDVERKFNIARLVSVDGKRDDAQIERMRFLVEALGIEQVDVVDRLADYMDADSSEGEYEAGARNKRLMGLDELLRVPGIEKATLIGDTEKGVSGLLDYVTLWPVEPKQAAPSPNPNPNPNPNPPPVEPHKISVNTAPLEVLMSLHKDITREDMQNLITMRTGQDGKANPFKDLTNVPGIPTEAKGLCSVESKTFEIHLRAVDGSIEKAWVYVVRFDETEKKWKKIASMRESDFLWVEPEKEQE